MRTFSILRSNAGWREGWFSDASEIEALENCAREISGLRRTGRARWQNEAASGNTVFPRATAMPRILKTSERWERFERIIGRAGFAIA